jgi:ElaB/YqjD/DUF883 family membrane-anchored ribosome-binding protein
MSSFRLFRPRGLRRSCSRIVEAKCFATVGDTSAMNAATNIEPDLAPIREDLDALKRDVAKLIEHMTGGAMTTVQSAAGEVERRVSGLTQRARSEGDRSAKALQLFVQDQPLVALTIAAGIGYVGARALRR